MNTSSPIPDYHWLRRSPLLLLVLLFLPSAGVAEDPDNCLLCHRYRGLGRYLPEEDTVHLYFVNPDYHRRELGPHARVACTDCHPRHEVAVIPHLPTSPVDCTQTCHLQDIQGQSRRFSHEHIERILAHSVHAPETLAKIEFAHGPLLGAGQSQCLYCHDEPVFRDPTRTIPALAQMGRRTEERCTGCHAQQIPTDTSYYLRHVAARLQRARPPLEQAQVCSVCHSDPRIREQFDMPDAAVHYTSTFHGKAALLGSERTADCISCHACIDGDPHLVRSHTDPESITHESRRAETCRSAGCHPGADPRIGRAAVHLDFPSLSGLEIGLAVFFVVFTMLTFGPSLVLTVLELFQVVIGRHAPGERAMHRLADEVLRHPRGRARLRRFTPAQRWQHWALFVLFTLLVLTGFPMKFADQTWSRHVIEFFGGLGVTRQIHRVAGVLLVIGFLAHLCRAGVSILQTARQRRSDGRRVGLISATMAQPMYVGPQDMLKTFQLLAYLLGLRKRPPHFGRFSVDQKFEYFGVFWGTMLLGVTGLILWDARFTSQYISGRAFNLALIAHTYEAFLAVIHVGILHICNVTLAPQVFPFSPATLTGNTPTERLAEVHGEYVIDAARDLGIPVPPEVERA